MNKWNRMLVENQGSLNCAKKKLPVTASRIHVIFLFYGFTLLIDFRVTKLFMQNLVPCQAREF